MTVAIPVLLWLLVAGIAVVVHRQKGTVALREAGDFALGSGLILMPRLLAALMFAAFLSQIVPAGVIGGYLGPESGVRGILVASIFGGLLPGGPMTSFPIAVFLWSAGGGTPQMVALLSGWSAFSAHRVLAYELPLMGWRFVALRMMAVAVIPPLTGLIAYALMALFGDALPLLPPKGG